VTLAVEEQRGAAAREELRVPLVDAEYVDAIASEVPSPSTAAAETTTQSVAREICAESSALDETVVTSSVERHGALAAPRCARR